MYKIININTQFQWRIITPKDENSNYVGICDRLKLTAEAENLNELVSIIQEEMQSLFLDLYYEAENGKEYFKFAWNHSVEFKVKEEDGYMYINPGPIVVE